MKNVDSVVFVAALCLSAFLAGMWFGEYNAMGVGTPTNTCVPPNKDSYGISYDNGECVIMRKDTARKMLAGPGKL
jgi:hypothetical protein